MQVCVSEIGLSRILLVFHIVMRHSWQFSTLPAEMSDVEGVMEGTEEEHAVSDECELIDVPQLGGVLGFDHFIIYILL